MTVPNFLAPYFRYKSLNGITTCADIIVAVRDELVTQPPLDTPSQVGWTEPVSGTFKSPVDADGRFYYVQLAVVISTQMTFIIQNQSGTTIFSGRIHLSGTGEEVRIYSGPFHLWVEGVTGTPEVAGAGLLDLFPRPQTYHSNYAWGTTYRDAGNSIVGPNSDYFTMFDNGSPVLTSRAVYETSGLGSAPLLDASGFTIHRPVTLVANMSGVIRRVGRLYHAYMVDSTLAAGAELQIPINDSPLTNGIFKVIGRAVGNGMKIAVRKG